MAHSSSRLPSLDLSLAQYVWGEYTEAEPAQMVGSAPHMDLIAGQGGAGVEG